MRGDFIRHNTCCLFGLKMSSHIDEKRYSVLVDYLTSCKEGDLRDSRVYPFGATANEKRRIRQQAAMFVLKERLLYYRATDAVNEICLKRVIANAKERTNIIHAAMMALMVANLPLRQGQNASYGK